MIADASVTNPPACRRLTELPAVAATPLPPAVVVEGRSIPEPHRTLLVHERDMTRTLEQFHGRTVHLEVLRRLRLEGGIYGREVVLRLDGSNRPVEFGVTQVHLDHFPEPWRTQILEERLPLGAILNQSGIPYTSRPSAWLRFQCDDFIAGIFGLHDRPDLYGRRNTLRKEHGEVLAEIIEILPPA